MPLDNEPLTNVEAKQLAREIENNGKIFFSKHARDEMEDDLLTDTECHRVIRGGICEGCDYINSSWRYRFYAMSIYVVLSFIDETRLMVVTVWRKKE